MHRIYAMGYCIYMTYCERPAPAGPDATAQERATADARYAAYRSATAVEWAVGNGRDRCRVRTLQWLLDLNRPEAITFDVFADA